MTQTNLLMRNSPDKCLQRIARLAKLPHDLDLLRSDCIIYCICGPHLVLRLLVNVVPFLAHAPRQIDLVNTAVRARPCETSTLVIRARLNPKQPIGKYGMGAWPCNLWRGSNPALHEIVQDFGIGFMLQQQIKKRPLGELIALYGS